MQILVMLVNEPKIEKRQQELLQSYKENIVERANDEAMYEQAAKNSPKIDKKYIEDLVEKLNSADNKRRFEEMVKEA